MNDEHWPGRRRALGSLAASAGAAALLASGAGVSVARAAAAGRSAPRDELPAEPHFTVTGTYRPVDLLPSRFIDYDTGPLAHTPGRLTSATGPAAPFASVLVDVAALPTGAEVAAGLETADGDRAVRARCTAQGTVSLEVVTPDGTTTVATAGHRLRPPFRLAFAVTGHTVAAFAATDGPGLPWRPLLTDGGAVAVLLDLRRPALLRRLRYACRSDSAVLRRVRGGLFGQLGLRDLHLVQEAEGRPYVRNGRVFFTAGCAGAGFSQEAHTGVWAMDPARPGRLEQVAKLFFARGGLLFGDHGGQVIYDAARNRFIVVTVGGNLPSPGVRLYHTTTSADLIRGVHVLDGRPLEFPFTRSAWDPALLRSNGRWLWAYVDVTAYQPELHFHPVLAAAARGGDYADGLARLPVPDGPQQTEGCRWQWFGGQPRLLVSDRAHRAYRRLDLAMRSCGTLDAPYPYGTPFPQVFRDPRRGQHGWLLVTFDETGYEQDVLPYGTHGRVVTMYAPGGRFP
ncbi:hypothetical protein [Streptomyces huiliensis]|uniref:hypothetical protein n=1 Tax=Streptomyces huiliensis TaxID=2876027 RepID=UPI001CBF2A5D|nr:hypothetical protein [Streptomyces huiliensis]MBZ4317850.1 hypothetical protein [Streptomyces huiliensis]